MCNFSNGPVVPIPTLPPSKTKLSVVALLFTLKGVPVAFAIVRLSLPLTPKVYDWASFWNPIVATPFALLVCKWAVTFVLASNIFNLSVAFVFATLPIPTLPEKKEWGPKLELVILKYSLPATDIKAFPVWVPNSAKFVGSVSWMDEVASPLTPLNIVFVIEPETKTTGLDAWSE